jgi:hypothetical protein
VGFFVTEVGVRQAWPFITFARNEESRRPSELRLVIDTTCEVSPPPALVLDLAADDPAGALPNLLEVLNLTVASVRLLDDGSLILDFDGGHTLRVSGAAQTWTTHDVWWLADPHASCPEPHP